MFSLYPTRSRLLRSLLFFFAFWACIFSNAIYAQTCSIPGNAGTASIAAQPNTFFAGTGNLIGASAITVGPAVGANSGLSAGDLVLVIQMQGADINFANANTYGSGSATTGTATAAFGSAGYAGGYVAGSLSAGNYEFALVASGSASFAAGGTINLTKALTNSYFTRSSSTTVTKVVYQVIRVPQYANLTVSSGFSVQPWDGSRGGVLVLEATGDINLNGQTINGSGLGFRGGNAIKTSATSNCSGGTGNAYACTEYVTTAVCTTCATNPSPYGAVKGEGIAGTPLRVYSAAGGAVTISTTTDQYPGGDGARGAPGNAGGGGNWHNGGGGGGGNGASTCRAEAMKL